MNDENAGMLEGWFSDPHSGSWYYLSETSGAIPLGAMYRSAWTPDGYLVDETGAWKEAAGRKQ